MPVGKIVLSSEAGDDFLDIIIRGEDVCHFNHDDLGWSGLKAVRKVIKIIADKYDIEIEEI